MVRHAMTSAILRGKPDAGNPHTLLNSRRQWGAFGVLGLALTGALSGWGASWSDYPTGGDVVIDGTMTVTDSDIATINGYNSLTLTESAEVTFDLVGSESLTCVTTNRGKIVKTGLGSLALDASSVGSYEAGEIEIVQGTFMCPQNLPEKVQKFFLGRVAVAKDAWFHTTQCSPPSAYSTTFIDYLTGEGVVTNKGSAANRLDVTVPNGRPCEFAGVISGKIRWFSSGIVYLTGTNSTFSGMVETYNGRDNVDVQGTTGLMFLGKKGKSSSMGQTASLTSRDYGARYLYLGKGEVTDHDYNYYNKVSGHHEMHYFDAGAHGGVTFTGGWRHEIADHPERVVLQGSNTVNACVLKGSWSDPTNSPTYVIKRGTGVWRLEDNPDRRNRGVIAVENGTLQFTSIAEANHVCSLGLACELLQSYSGDYDASKAVDYAYLLGSKQNRGVMEFVGTGANACTTRPFVVNGQGELRNSPAAYEASLQLAGVTAAKNTASTLVLSGEADNPACLADVGDGDGTLTVVKEGSGTWSLEGRQDFSGKLQVKEGTFEVRGARRRTYEYFRFTVRGTYYCHDPTKDDQQVELAGIELYDAEGNSLLNKDNMTFVKGYETPSEASVPAGDWKHLQPGEYSWATEGTYRYYTLKDIDRIFWISMEDNRACVFFNGKAPKLSDPQTHCSLVFRIPQGIAPVAAFDILAQRTTKRRQVSDWTMEASEDGRIWHEVGRYDYPAGGLDGMPLKGYWYSDKDVSYESTKGKPRPNAGYPVAEPGTDADVGALANVSEVTVACGATLRAKGGVKLPTLSFDCNETAPGIIEGFDFAETGTLTLTNLPKDGITLPDVFVNCVNLDRVCSWTLNVDGRARHGFKIVCRGNRLSIVPKGMILILR